MSHLKSHHSPISALELQRSYVYMVQSTWSDVEDLRAGTGLSVSQLLSQLVIKAVVAKGHHDHTSPRN